MFKVYFLSTLNLTSKISTFHLKVQASHFSFPEISKKKYQTPKQKFKTGVWMISSQEMGSSLVSLERISEALRFEIFRLKYHLLSLKIIKIPEINLLIAVFLYKSEEHLV